LACQGAQGLAAAHQAGLVHGHLRADHFVLTPGGVLKLAGFGEPPWLAEPGSSYEEDFATDVRAFGRIVSAWADPGGTRKGSKGLPREAKALLERLTAEELERRYPGTAEMLADLERLSAEMPAKNEAWESLLGHIGEHATQASTLRQSA
jgi:hypothetical protein